MIIAGGNNLQHDSPSVIADATTHTAEGAQSKGSPVQIYVESILPRENISTYTKAIETNEIVESKCDFLKYILFL